MYLARFHRSVVALGGEGPRPRLMYIDRTYNLPGYPDGMNGARLLLRLQEQALEYGGAVLPAVATRVSGEDGDFRIELSDGNFLQSRKIILAMGVRDRCPDIPGSSEHEGHFIRYCPVCDGFEHTDKKMGIVGSGPSVARHALFLQTFSNQVTVYLHGAKADSLGSYRAKLDRAGIAVCETRIAKIMEEHGDRESEYIGCGVCLEDGSEHPLSVLYSALGCELHLEPVNELNLEKDDDGYVLCGADQQTNVPGIYAAGDIVSQINQISVAFGQATVAAVRIHNTLDDD